MPTKQRLLSLDTLRGFDMFWIIGGDLLFRKLGEVTNWPWAVAWANQMDHVPWAGFHAYDLVFPLFMFISGVAIPFAISKKMEQGVSKYVLYKKVFFRAIILILLGLVYNGLLDFDFKTLRYASVLGQIGLAYLIASILAINTMSFKARLAWFIGILAGYLAIQLFVPVPGFGAGHLTPSGSINSYIDSLFLPGRMYGKTFDPEGLLCILSASAITILGVLAGQVLQLNRVSGYKKVGILAAFGGILVSSALLVENYYPFIKAAWTSSFNLLAGGLSLLILSLFYLIIDVLNFHRWTFFFRVIGLNSITIYMVTRIVDFRPFSEFFFHGTAGLFSGYGPIVILLGILLLEWLLLYFLYKRSIFLKI